MPLYRQTILLFSLNLLDAVFTIYWVRHGFATEANHLMASLMEIGDLPFLAVKIAIGAVAATVLWRWRALRLARYGLTAALAVYVGLMGIHLFTGLSAAGVISENFAGKVSNWSQQIFAFII